MYDHALLAIFLNFVGFIFIVYVGRKKNEMVAWWDF
jgi:cbb3-type cytochrome oxidase subunit 3